MKFYFITAAALLTLTPVYAATRTFTSTDGRTVVAEITSATSAQATLKLADGRETVVPLNRLSPADQEYVATWIKQNPQAIRYSFAVDVTKDKVSSNESRPRRGITQTSTKWLYHIKVSNRGAQDLEGLKASYQIHYSDEEGKAKVTEVKSGTVNVPKLDQGTSTSVDTEPVELITTELDSGYYWENGAPSKQKDTIKGIAVTIEHHGKSVYEYSSSTSVKKVAVRPEPEKKGPKRTESQSK